MLFRSALIIVPFVLSFPSSCARTEFFEDRLLLEETLSSEGFGELGGEEGCEETVSVGIVMAVGLL